MARSLYQLQIINSAALGCHYRGLETGTRGPQRLGHSCSLLTRWKVLASASDDKTVRLWNANTWAWKQTLEGHSDLVTAVAFSSDGKVLASASIDETVRLWDTTTGPGNRHSRAIA